MPMFNGIKLKTLLSTPEEWHAFLIGLFEVLCPWRAARPTSPKSQDEIDGEDHYYMAGRGAGFVALLLILTGLTKLIKEVLL